MVVSMAIFLIWESHFATIDDKELFLVAKLQIANCKCSCNSVLRPLFFLIYFNNLPEGLKSDAEHFANNASLFSVIKCVKISALIINNDLLKLQC